MIGIIDPALLLPRPDQDICSDLDLVLLACRRNNIRIVAFSEYWSELWKEFGRPLEQSAGPNARAALRALRNSASVEAHNFGTTPAKVWKRGFTQLFENEPFGDGWIRRMASVMVKAVISNDPVVLFTRRIEGRNLMIHQAANVFLHENTRWVLHISAAGIGQKQVLCVYDPRNLSEKWTCRFDWRLPSQADGGRLPFIPPDYWWKGSVESVRTISAKPCWVDVRKNGWARPNTPGAGNHWDVFLSGSAENEDFGLNPVNITQYPSDRPRPGDIHHVPTGKAARFIG